MTAPDTITWIPVPDFVFEKLSNWFRTMAEVRGDADPFYAEKYGLSITTKHIVAHPYCWCDGPLCPWCSPSQVARPDLGIRSGEKAANAFFPKHHLSINWYKYIGRDMRSNRSLSVAEWQAVFDDLWKDVP